jgi:hypothetical protein
LVSREGPSPNRKEEEPKTASVTTETKLASDGALSAGGLRADTGNHGNFAKLLRRPGSSSSTAKSRRWRFELYFELYNE